MKAHLFYFAMATSGAMLLAGCSQNELSESPSTGGNATVNFSITAPTGLDTRAFGDGKTATQLRYAVYDASNHHLAGIGNVGADDAPVAITNREAQVTLQLVKGNTYKVVFWAEAEGAPYHFDWTNAKMTVDPQKLVSSDEKGDAFYNVSEIHVTADAHESVTLHRPYAQLNIGTDDIAASKAAGFDPTHTSVTMTGVPNAMNLLDGTVSGSANVTYTLAARPDATAETFPVDGYTYLDMAYVLMGDKQTSDVTFRMAADAQGADLHERTFAAVPLQRNYRTNIYGSLLTNEVDYNVVIDPNWDGAHPVNVIEAKTQAQMVAALSVADATVKLEPNTTYTLPRGASIAEGVTIVGGEGVVMSTPVAGTTNGNVEFASGLKNVTFKNLTIDWGNANYNGFTHSESITYDHCTITGQICYNADHTVFNDCTFKQTDGNLYNAWSYASNIQFNRCTFEAAKRCVNVYNEGNQTAGYYVVEFNGCTFKRTAGNCTNPIQINANAGRFDVRVNNCSVEGFTELYFIKDTSKEANLKLSVDGQSRPSTPGTHGTF